MSGPRSKRRKSRKSSRKLSTDERASLVHADMLQNPSLSLRRAARKRRIDPRSVLGLLRTKFRKDSSGRIKARAIVPSRQTLYIPWFEPGEEMPVPTKSRSERLLVGRWMADLNAAGRGDFSKIDKFPKNKVIGGVRLPTKIADIQRILNSLAQRESPYERLYRTLARPS